MSELPSKFNFKKIDDKWCKYWEKNNIFHATGNPSGDKKPYSIVIPPPNVTGILHMGHALNNTLQDIIIRYKRMKGFETCWMPGTDHAGIATQNVVEKQIAKEGKTRQDIGREAFVEKLWEWKKEYGDTIIHQLKKLGSSCDWQRTRFTMDDDYCKTVKHAFVKLHKEGLIYRGEYIINWCPRCLTALSDEEAEHHETEGHLYHIRYPFKDNPDQDIVVATTRPETMLGDTAVAVNPNDARYKNLIGKKLILPLINREIPVIADEFVDPEFGTGAVKVTPAHDPNDFAMGKRHDLKFINIMHPDASLNKEAGDFEGMDRFEAREAIVETLRGKKLLVNIETHSHSVGHCYRCHTVVEPYLSKQWFVRMKGLAKPAIEAVDKGEIKFYPDRWTKVYMNWMENIRDWCISRQIWWGHRIPVWYCQDCPEGNNIIVSEDTPKQCPECKSKNLVQDEDVLDTWFSSWLWPFATFGWPDENKDLKYFYPTASLFTAPEIIFFWVARMIMSGLKFMGEIPFSDIYLHGTVRDSKGRKMSKSLGNALDPLEIINEYGADALRYSLIINFGQDIFISKKKFEIGRNFANKVWNAARLILMNTDGSSLDPDFKLEDVPENENLDLPSRWIVSVFFEICQNVTKAIEKYRYSEAEIELCIFFKDMFCGYYLEIIKDRWEDKTICAIALKILEDFLKILHPFMPFVTEEIYSNLKKENGDLCMQPWPELPKYSDNPEYKKINKKMFTINQIVERIRFHRVQLNIPPAKKIKCYFASSLIEDRNLLKDNESTLKKLAKLNEIKINEHFPEEEKIIERNWVATIELGFPLKGTLDIDKEIQKKLTEIEKLEKGSRQISGRLSNKSFLEKAPEEVVEKEKGKLAAFKIKIDGLNLALASLTENK